MNFISCSASFWSKHPALCIALGLLCGILTTAPFSWMNSIPIALFILMIAFSTKNLLRILFAICFVLPHILFTKGQSLPPQGTYAIDVTQIKKVGRSARPLWLYFGKVEGFVDAGGNFKKLFPAPPIVIKVRDTKQNPRKNADKKYLVKGKLKAPLAYTSWSLETDYALPWQDFSNFNRPIEKRYQLKTSLQKNLEQEIVEPRAASVVKGLLLGALDDKTLLFLFNRLGLQHILAVSGFHFSWILFLASLLLRPFLHYRASLLLLLCLATFYAFLLGLQPSIARAWIAASLSLIAPLLGRQVNSINALGLGMIVILWEDPQSAFQAGFQLSFGITASLLFFHQTILDRVEIQLSTKLLQEGIAILISVSIVAIPLTLFHFHRFPLLSPLFNLIIPTLLSVSMLMGLIGLFVPAFLSEAVHTINTFYTTLLIDLLETIPLSADLFLKTASVEAWMVGMYLVALLAIGIVFKDKSNKYALHPLLRFM